MTKLYEQKYKEFLKTLDKAIRCPYCGEDNQLDPPRCCCGEMHAAETWLDKNGNLYQDDELEGAFQEYCLSNPLSLIELDSSVSTSD